MFTKRQSVVNSTLIPLIFAHPSKMNFRAPFNFRASHNFRGTFGVFSDVNIDKEGKKETKLEL